MTIFNFLRACPVFGIFILTTIACSQAFCQAFVSDPNIPNPKIAFINDSVVRLHYDSIYQVHEWFDTIQYPQILEQQNPVAQLRNGLIGKYDYARIFADLMTVLDAREYHSIGIYSDDDLRYGELPGWIHSGPRNKYLAKNIGHNNHLVDCGPFFPERGKNFAMLHMNNVEFIDRPIGFLDNYGSTLTYFHELGHNWGVHWRPSVGEALNWSFSDWEPWMPTLYLIVGGTHWINSSERWVNPNNMGILPSGPIYNRWNVFDLYAMGIMPYNQLQDSVIWARDTATLNEYPITIDSLITTLGKAQHYIENTPLDQLPDYLENWQYIQGDGKRIPAVDLQMQELKALIVVVTGKESIFTQADSALLLGLARDIPPDWKYATYKRSSISTMLTHKMVNNIYLTLSSTSLLITVNDFLSGYEGYLQADPESIQIVSLPSAGTLFYNLAAVHQGQVLTMSDLTSGKLRYIKNGIPKKFAGDEFTWNAMTQGRWAVPGKVIINPVDQPGTQIQNNIAAQRSVENPQLLSAFPNPFNEVITLKANSNINAEVLIKIRDDNGTLLYSTLLNGLRQNEEIKIESLQKSLKGPLHISINTQGQTQTMKIFKR